MSQYSIGNNTDVMSNNRPRFRRNGDQSKSMTTEGASF